MPLSLFNETARKYRSIGTLYVMGRHPSRERIKNLSNFYSFFSFLDWALSFHFCHFLLYLIAGSNLHSLAMGAVYSHDEWELSRDLLVTGQKIGEGQFGVVLEGTLMTGR